MRLELLPVDAIESNGLDHGTRPRAHREQAEEVNRGDMQDFFFVWIILCLTERAIKYSRRAAHISAVDERRFTSSAQIINGIALLILMFNLSTAT